MNRPSLDMQYMGSDWLVRNLGYAEQRKRNPSEVVVSPLGLSVADLIGFVWRGIYHLPWSLLERTDWSDDRCIEVRVREDLATWDFDRLTRLVVVAFDMGLRMSIRPNGPYGLRLCFWQRKNRIKASARNGIATGVPDIEDMVRAIRSGYQVEGGPS